MIIKIMIISCADKFQDIACRQNSCRFAIARYLQCPWLPPSAASSHLSPADLLDDLYSFDPATMAWTLLSAAPNDGRPAARHGHGFTSAGGKLYLHGGKGKGGA